jgi:ATP-binding cassette subfamily C protein
LDAAKPGGASSEPGSVFHIRGLTKIYRTGEVEVHALRGVDLDIVESELLVLLGPSGSGKSTLARALVGTVKPTRGGVFFDGTSTFLWERASFGRIVGYLPQQVSIMDGTVRDNIARMQEAEPSAVLAAARAAGVHALIGRLPFGYDTQLTDTTALLSGGQMQRIALARALFGDPQLLVLDEPNSNLDADGERALMDSIEAAKSRGAIVVLIAHRPSLMSCADEIVVMQEGTIVQRGPRTDVVQTLGSDLRPATKPRVANDRSIADQTDR